MACDIHPSRLRLGMVFFIDKVVCIPEYNEIVHRNIHIFIELYKDTS